MIVVALIGGLGNQMFQYALGHRMAHDRHVPLRLDLSRLNDPSRPFALDAFKIEATAISAADLRRIRIKFPCLQRKFPWIGKIFPSALPLIAQKKFSFDADILDAPTACYLDGYWQTEKYFASVADDIRRQFQLAAPMTPSRQTIAALIRQSEAVALHVRRGDYVTNAKANAYHGTCAPEWYARAVALVKERTANPVFFVFSDDPEWARQNLPMGDSVAHYADPQTDKRDAEDMHLMALCKHNIIANSSFSWWGAWLNSNPDKIVIAPQRWFADGHKDTQDITPSSWIRL